MSKCIHRIVFTSIVMCGLFTVAPSAWAAGPLWLVKGTRFDCESVTTTAVYFSLLNCLGGPAGNSTEKWERKQLSNTAGELELDQGAEALIKQSNTFKLQAGAVATIECTSLDAPTILVGGVPGKDHTEFVMTGCTVAGKPECDVRSSGRPFGTIAFPAKSELVLRKGELNTRNNAAELFEPENGTTFTEIEVSPFSMGACGTLPEITPLTGSMAATVEPANTLSAELFVKFPAEAITKVFRWTGVDTWMEVQPKLKAIGVVNAKLVGEATLKPSNGGELAADIG
jgi:hypothetical protein